MNVCDVCVCVCVCVCVMCFDAKIQNMHVMC